MSVELNLLTKVRTQVGHVRVYQVIAVDGAARPYVVQTLISKTEVGMGVTRYRFQLDSWADTYAQAKNQAQQITAAIRSLELGPAANVSANYRENEQDLYERETSLHRVSIDAVLFYEEKPTFS